ncbi:craniofacial development protein 2 [Biomphalaria glabrata]|nr:craniofacial development protein 2 [Biomphalaria glabrata]
MQPTNAEPEEEKKELYNALQFVLEQSPKRDNKLIMVDMKAKVGTNDLYVEKHSAGTCNNNGDLFADLCPLGDVIIDGTIFPHKTSTRQPGLPWMIKQKI